MMRLAFVVIPLLALLGAAGCATDTNHKTADNAAINKRAAAEIERICALHGPERDVELKKLKTESGLELYCPD